MKVSVCIPAYYSGPETPRVLGELLDSIAMQDYHDIEVVVSLQKSGDTEGDRLMLEPLVKHCVKLLTPGKDVDGPAKNVNFAMAAATGDYVKIMNQDDFLGRHTTLTEMVRLLRDTGKPWLVNACVHTGADGKARDRVHYAQWPGKKNMVEGMNRFGCPSVSMFPRAAIPECDPELILCMDCDMWIQLVDNLGVPVIRMTPDVVIRMWDAQLSNQLDYGRSLETDKVYMRKKYGYT